MAQSMISCPLCSSASFSSINALCLSLVNISSKWLHCTVCQEELHGLDKLTIHLLSHLTHNPDFVKTFSNGNGSSSSDCNSEPLNLAKSYTNCSKDGDCNTYFPSKDISNMELEKSSIKIDDEVMIVFKHNEKYLESNLSTVCDKSSLSVKSSSNPSSLTADFNRKFDSPNVNDELFSFNSSENRSNGNLYDPPSTYQCQSNNAFLVKDGNSYFCKDGSDLCAEQDSQPDSDISLSHKNISTQNVDSLNDTNIISDIEKSETLDLNKKPGMKCSFLSPKGERVLGFRCDVCSLVFPDEHILSLHRQLIHIELNDDPAKTNHFKCHLCSKSFVMRGSLMVHIRVAHFGGAVVARLIETKQLENNAVSPDSAQFVCSICNKGFRKEQQLIQHEKLHDGKQCDVCLKTFTTKYFLRKHKRLHTGEMPYSCSICNKSFTFQQSYHKHLLYHSDDKPYSCPECGRAFKELSTLHNHQRIHTGEKPFSCETCGKCFRQRVSYLVHRRIHTGVLPYQCQECGKKFRYKVSERTHKCTISTIGSGLETAISSLEGKPHENTYHTSENMAHSEETKDKRTNEGEVFKAQTPADQNMSGVDSLMDNNFPEATDFFSLVMSPADRLQHLSLATEEQSPCQDSAHQSIDTESLKELLYDVADYT